MYKSWLQLLMGALVIFFAGKNYIPYGQFCLAQADIRRDWLRALLWEIFKVFPEFCILIHVIFVAQDPLLGLSTVLGIILIHLVLLAWFLYNKLETFKTPLSAWFLTSFIVLLSISTGLQLGFGFLKVGLASILILGSYVVYFRLMLVGKEIPLPQFSLKPTIIYIRFLIAFLLILGGAAQVTYAAKMIVSQFHISSTFTGMLFLAPIACLPRLSMSFLQKDSMMIEELLQSSIFILGVFVFLIDFFYLHEVVFVKTETTLFYLTLEALLFSLLILMAINYLQHRKKISILIMLGYVGSFISMSRFLK